MKFGKVLEHALKTYIPLRDNLEEKDGFLWPTKIEPRWDKQFIRMYNKEDSNSKTKQTSAI